MQVICVTPLKVSNTYGFRTCDSLNLKCRLILSEKEKPLGTIILLHGIRSNKDFYLPFQQILADSGYHSIAMDLRAHGESEGQHCTFGVKEKKDVAALLNVLEKRDSSWGTIGIWGQSLGGAIALQAMAHGQRIQFGIVESTFSYFPTIAHDYFKQYLGFGFGPFTNYLVSRAGKIASFNPKKASPIKACSQISQPVFMAHGTADTKISIKYGQQNFAALANKTKVFVPIKHAGHANLWKKGGESYFTEVFKFMRKYTNVSNTKKLSQ